MPNQNNIPVMPPKTEFTKDELKMIKTIHNPTLYKEAVEKELKEINDICKLDDNGDKDKPYPINTINKQEISEIDQTVSIDPNTGLHTPISKDEINDIGDFGLTVPLDQIEEFDINSVEVKDEDSKSIKDVFGINDNDAMEMVKIIKEYKNGDTKHLFSRLPSSMKHHIISLTGTTTNKAVLNKVSKEFIEMSISQIGTDQSFVDLEKGLEEANKELKGGFKNLAREAIDIEKNDYELKLKLYIDNLKEKHPEKEDEIKKWETVRDRYFAATSFEELKQAITTTSLLKKMNKYERMTREFNYKYSSETKKTKFACRDINFATKVLSRHLNADEYPDDLIKKFICAICKYTKNYDATNIIDHTFMYFTIKTITSIETFNYSDEEYSSTISKIKEILDIIKEKEA